MGNKQATTSQSLKFNQSQWELLRSNKDTKIYSHTNLAKQGEVAFILADTRYDINNEMEIYNYRKGQDHALVEVYSVDNLKANQATICGNQQNIKVMYQHIPKRLKDLPQLTFPQSVYVLSQSLRGYRECYSKVGRFIVTDKMIGINIKGNIKIWLNQNFAENHPVYERPLLQITKTSLGQSSANKDQEAMIKNIMGVIEDKCQEGHFPTDFKQQMSDCLSFEDAYCQIESYCTQKKMWIPDRIPLSNDFMTSKSQDRLSSFHLQHTQSVTVLKPFQLNESQPHAVYIPNNQCGQAQNKEKGEICYEQANKPNPTIHILNKGINRQNHKQTQPDVKNSEDQKYYGYHYSNVQKVQGDTSLAFNRVILSPKSQKIPPLGFYSNNHPANIQTINNYPKQ